MSELSQALLPEDKKLIDESPPTKPIEPVPNLEDPAIQEGDMLTEQPPPIERSTEEQSVLDNLPENVYDEQAFQSEVQKSTDDEIYRQSLISRGHDPDKLKSANEKIREKQVLNFLIKLSEHPNGSHHVQNLIYNIVHEEGDF